MITILSFLFVLVFCNSIAQESNSKPNVCQTSECIRVASFVLKNLNESVDPCDDFYKFACGKFGEANNVGSDENPSNCSLLSKNIEKLKMQLVTEKPLQSDAKHLKVPNAFYDACTNTDDLPTEPIAEIMNLTDGWPVLSGDSWNFDGSWSWQETLKKLDNFGIKSDAIFKTPIFRNRWIVDPPKIDEYDDQIANLSIVAAVKCGANETRAKIEYQQVFELEKNLRNISVYSTWEISIQFNEGKKTYVVNYPFFEDLGQILRKTPNRTIANYISWQLHMQSFPKAKMLQTEKTNLSESCMQETLEYFPTEITLLAIRKYLKSGSKDVVKDMVKNINESFSGMLPDVAWMNETTREAAQHKLQRMRAIVGYEQNEFNETNDFLEKYYQSFDINMTQYFDWVQKLKLLPMTSKLKNFGFPRKTFFTFNPLKLTETYSPRDNAIVLPLATHQKPNFNPQWPKYINYGSIGSGIGHEISHGLLDSFQSGGSHIDPIFECIAKQFEKYTDPTTTQKVDLSQYQMENNADNGGLKAAYQAYKKWVAQNGPELTLPGLNYTAKQLFWISAGQNHCEKYTTESIIKCCEDSHPPGDLRVTAMMSNSVEFSEDFQCPAEAKMNPANKCLIL